MTAKQSVYLNLERDKALPEGHEDAKFLLVRAGQEVAEADLERYEGASDLAEAEPEPKEEVVIPPPNLKDHSADEKSHSAIPSPKIKGNKDSSEVPKKPAVPSPTKLPKTGTRATGHPRAKKSPK
jgi:hypothetical protein